jgi:hypothetical protein
VGPAREEDLRGHLQAGGVVGAGGGVEGLEVAEGLAVASAIEAAGGEGSAIPGALQGGVRAEGEGLALEDVAAAVLREPARAGAEGFRLSRFQAVRHREEALLAPEALQPLADLGIPDLCGQRGEAEAAGLVHA